jgi:quercetin dioxygenase-like cupin family protein
MMDESFRRVVTGHDVTGVAVVTGDHQLFRRETPLPGMRGVDIWRTLGLPTTNYGAADDADQPVVDGQRILLRTVELAPGASAGMHRTLTLDFGVVLSGQCELKLDGGERVVLVSGDVVIQRGTLHAWSNPNPEPCSLLFVLIDAVGVKIGQRELGPSFSGEYPADFDVMRSPVRSRRPTQSNT